MVDALATRAAFGCPALRRRIKQSSTEGVGRMRSLMPWVRRATGNDADKEEPLSTAGTNAARVDRILPTSDLMAELAGVRQMLPSAA